MVLFFGLIWFWLLRNYYLQSGIVYELGPVLFVLLQHELNKACSLALVLNTKIVCKGASVVSDEIKNTFLYFPGYAKIRQFKKTDNFFKILPIPRKSHIFP